MLRGEGDRGEESVSKFGGDAERLDILLFGDGVVLSMSSDLGRQGREFGQVDV
jgi:hypothetical protein